MIATCSHASNAEGVRELGSADLGLRRGADHSLELAEGYGVESDLLGRRVVNICLASEEGGQLGQYHDGRGGWGKQ